MVQPAVEAPTGGQMAAEEVARRANPEAVEARTISAHAYEGLSTELAENMANGPATSPESTGANSNPVQ